MNFHVGVLTRNALSTLRWGLLEQTLASLPAAFPGAARCVIDNDSDDGSCEALRHLEMVGGALFYRSNDGNTSPGRGRNQLMRTMLPRGSSDDVVVLSDDDVAWRDGAMRQLEAFWSEAPDDVAILSCLLEPDWPWNTPRELIECGGVKALVRDSAPAAAWTFRMGDWTKIGPLRESLTGDGEDFDACKRLRAAGFRVAQIDLAHHLGDGYSQIGNDKARALAGRPLDREKWGL